MGFGFLLIGYLFFANFVIGTSGDIPLRFDIMPDLVAWIFLLLGTLRLKQWSNKFKTASLICMFMLPVSLFSLLCGLDILVRTPETWWFYESILPYASGAVLLCFHYFLLFGVREIAAGCEGQGQFCAKITRGFYITAVCFALTLAAMLIPRLFAVGQVFQQVLLLIQYILRMVWLIYNEVCLIGAYRRITLG